MIKKILLSLAFLGTLMAHGPDSRIFYLHESIESLDEWGCTMILGCWQVFTKDPTGTYSDIPAYSLTGYTIRKAIERTMEYEKNKAYMAQLAQSLPESTNAQPDTLWGKMSASIARHKYGFAAAAVVAAGIALYGAYTYFQNSSQTLAINPSDVD